MKILRLSYVNLKRMSKNKGNLVLMFIMPLAIILGIHFTTSNTDHNLGIDAAFNIEDKGEYGEEILKSVGFEGDIFYNDNGTLKLLEENKIVALYTIPNDFTEKIKNGEKPQIKTYKKEEGNVTTSLEIKLNDEINNKIKEEMLLKHNIIKDKGELYKFKGKTLIQDEDTSSISGDSYMAILMIIYFIILSSTGIGEEIIKLKKQNILFRAMTTANKGYEIMGSLFLSTLFLLVGSNLLVLILTKIIMGYSIKSLFVVFLNIVLASMFSITLTIFLIRISEDLTFVSMTTAIYSVASFFLSMIAASSDFYSDVPNAIINLGKFMPQYWLMDSIENSSLFPNVLVLGLMILALFTAGSYRFKDFVNKG